VVGASFLRWILPPSINENGGEAVREDRSVA
jgi:hypothetical protein